MQTFDERVLEFNKKIYELQEEYGVSLYAANVVLKNAEVIPLVRVSDALKKEEDIIINEEKDAVTTKSGNSRSTKAQKNKSKS